VYSFIIALNVWLQEDFPEHRSPITVGDKEIDLNKIFTPAPDADEYLIKKDSKLLLSI
jgi:hypothetical protein